MPGGGIRRKKGLRKSIKKNLPDEIKQLLGEAHVAYVSNDIPHAMKCLQEVVRQDANVPDPYRTLAAIYEEIEQDKQRLGLLVSSCTVHMPPGPKPYPQFACLQSADYVCNIGEARAFQSRSEL